MPHALRGGWSWWLVAGWLAAVIPDVEAQVASSAVTGTVYDSSGNVIAGAEVGVVGTPKRTRSDDRGAFRLAGLETGPVTLAARRLGFQPETVRTSLGPSSVTGVDFRLSRASVTLSPIVVRGRGHHTGRLAGFYERLASGVNGYFLTRERIDEGNPRSLTDVLRRVPGLEIARGSRLRMRGRTCAPLVWIDGIAMPSGEVDLNSIPPGSIEGIELYLSASGAPNRYQPTADRARCGTVLLWSRGPDTELRRRPLATSAEELERQHRDGDVLTAAQVDVAARLAEPQVWPVIYPAELYAEHVRGSVLLEVVVDSSGRVRETTFGVIFASHPLFARAAQEALRGVTFQPALLNGRAVAQIVHVPFRFEPPGRTP